MEAAEDQGLVSGDNGRGPEAVRGAELAAAEVFSMMADILVALGAVVDLPLVVVRVDAGAGVERALEAATRALPSPGRDASIMGASGEEGRLWVGWQTIYLDDICE